MKKIIDTNILLDNSFEQIIQSLKKEDEPLELIITYQVIKELDTFKVGLETINNRARQAIRFIEEARHCGNLLEGVLVEDNTKLFIKHPNTWSFEDKDGTPDLKILQEAVIDVKPENQGEEFKGFELISSDLHARILANCFGIKSEDLTISTENKKYMTKTSIDVTDDQLTSLYRNYKTGLPIEGDYSYNEYIEMRDTTGSTHHGIYDKDTHTVKRLKDSYDAWGARPRLDKDGFPIIEQKLLMHFLLDQSIDFLSVIGNSGCGKTFLALACALEQTFGAHPKYDKIIIMRPLAAIDRDIGALPGDKIEKLTPWMGSITDNLSILLTNKVPVDFGNGYRKDDTSYMNVSEKITNLISGDKLELEALTYIRGRSLPKAFILIDDAQNLTTKEAITIVTRVGEGSKLVFLGDISPAQIDNPRLNQYNNGLTYVRNKLAGIDSSIAHVEMTEVVRSKLASLGVEYL